MVFLNEQEIQERCDFLDTLHWSQRIHAVVEFGEKEGVENLMPLMAHIDKRSFNEEPLSPDLLEPDPVLSKINQSRETTVSMINSSLQVLEVDFIKKYNQILNQIKSDGNKVMIEIKKLHETQEEILSHIRTNIFLRDRKQDENQEFNKKRKITSVGQSSNKEDESNNINHKFNLRSSSKITSIEEEY
jgi:hypothetical protein